MKLARANFWCPWGWKVAGGSCAASLAIAAIGALANSGSRDFPIHPSEGGVGWSAYDDRSAGGGSFVQTLRVGDTLSWVVHKHVAVGAYWGVEWAPRSQGFWKWDDADSVVMWVRTRRASQLSIFVCSHDPLRTLKDDPLTRRYLTSEISSGPAWARRSVALSQFQPPKWWLERQVDLKDPQRRYLDRIQVIQIGPGTGVEGLTDTLEIAQVKIVRRHFPVWPWILLAAISGSMVVAIRRKTPHEESVEAPRAFVEPKHLEMPPPDLPKLLQHLASNYNREELDLSLVAFETGLSAKKVTALLKSQSQTFRSALNQLRLSEAKRLLLETDLQASEIAYKVGYGNVSHFHRQFREAFGNSPLSVRSELRKASKH